MENRISFLRLLFLSNICFILVYCNSSNNNSQKNNNITDTIAQGPHPRENDYNKKGIADNKKLVKTGDLILRNGEDFMSAMARDFSKTDKSYSHCGIAAIENDTVYVYHCIGDAHYGGVRKDLFEEFCTYKENLSFGIYQYNFSNIIMNKFIETIKKRYKEKIKFDSDFNLVTDSAQYCSEFIYKAIIVASDSTIVLPIQEEEKIVGVDNLYLNPYTKKIASFDFKINR